MYMTCIMRHDCVFVLDYCITVNQPLLAMTLFRDSEWKTGLRRQIFATNFFVVIYNWRTKKGWFAAINFRDDEALVTNLAKFSRSHTKLGLQHLLLKKLYRNKCACKSFCFYLCSVRVHNKLIYSIAYGTNFYVIYWYTKVCRLTCMLGLRPTICSQSKNSVLPIIVVISCTPICDVPVYDTSCYCVE